MADLFLLRAAADEQAGRVPADLHLASSTRSKLESALRSAGLAVVSLNAVVNDPDAVDEIDQRALRAAVSSVVNDADAGKLERLRAAATAEPDDGLDEALWGTAPDSAALSHAVFAHLRDQFAQRRQLAERSISRGEAAELLGVAAQSITTRLAAGKLVGMKIGRQWRLPPWQFDPSSPAGVLPNLDELQEAFPGGPVSLSRWMVHVEPEFGGRTPVQEMVARGSEPVIALARALTAAAW